VTSEAKEEPVTPKNELGCARAFSSACRACYRGAQGHDDAPSVPTIAARAHKRACAEPSPSLAVIEGWLKSNTPNTTNGK
jgi:hypothetical protein